MTICTTNLILLLTLWSSLSVDNDLSLLLDIIFDTENLILIFDIYYSTISITSIQIT